MVILRNLIRSFKYAGSLTAPAPSAAAMCVNTEPPGDLQTTGYAQPMTTFPSALSH